MPILRMKGVTQSYDMYDSQLYKKAKTVMKEIMMWLLYLIIFQLLSNDKLQVSFIMILIHLSLHQINIIIPELWCPII